MKRLLLYCNFIFSKRLQIIIVYLKINMYYNNDKTTANILNFEQFLVLTHTWHRKCYLKIRKLPPSLHFKHFLMQRKQLSNMSWENDYLQNIFLSGFGSLLTPSQRDRHLSCSFFCLSFFFLYWQIVYRHMCTAENWSQSGAAHLQGTGVLLNTNYWEGLEVNCVHCNIVCGK